MGMSFYVVLCADELSQFDRGTKPSCVWRGQGLDEANAMAAEWQREFPEQSFRVYREAK
jgi:hypothetical protein